MPVDLVMPRLSDTMSEGTVARWLKKPGDAVKRGEALAEIETDKATLPMEAFEDGTMGAIRVAEGQTVPLGEVIGVLYRPGESAETGAADPGERTDGGAAASPAAAEPVSAQAAQKTDAPTEAVSAGDSAADVAGARVRASPLARRMAAEHGIDLSSVEGTGPAGRIVRADIEALLEVATAAPEQIAPAAPRASAEATQTEAAGAGDLVPFTRLQVVANRRLTEAKQHIPHIYVTVAINMGAAMRFRAESNAFLGKEGALTVNHLFMKGVALALRRYAIVNAAYTEKGVQHNPDINVGFAVPVDGGLVVPVVRNTDRKTLPQIAAESKALIEKARGRGLGLSDYEGGTFSISNLGMFGVEAFAAIVNPPQAAILAVGGTSTEPIVVDGQLAVGQVCRVTLSADHRVVYGADAAGFLHELKNLLEKPFALVF